MFTTASTTLFKSLIRIAAVCLVASVMLVGSELEARSGVSPRQAMNDAQQLLERFPEWSLYRGEGTSMEPRFDATHLLFVKAATLEELRPGMIAVFRDAEGDVVAHNVLRIEEAGIVSRGLNNARHDPALIPGSALVGVLVGTLAANASIPSEWDLPVALGKHY